MRHAQESQPEKKGQHPGAVIAFRVDEKLSQAVAKAAAKELLPVSAYSRRALAQALCNAGFEVLP